MTKKKELANKLFTYSQNRTDCAIAQIESNIEHTAIEYLNNEISTNDIRAYAMLSNDKTFFFCEVEFKKKIEDAFKFSFKFDIYLDGHINMAGVGFPSKSITPKNKHNLVYCYRLFEAILKDDTTFFKKVMGDVLEELTISLEQYELAKELCSELAKEEAL